MHEIKMPQMGQSVEEASIVAWLKQEGDAVKEGDALFTIQTDKAEIECEATASGVLRKILVQPDVTVPVLTVIAFVGDANEPLPELAATAGETPSASSGAQPESQPSIPGTTPSSFTPVPINAGTESGRLFVSPRAKATAESLGINPAVVRGTGPTGRVIETDIVAYADKMDHVRATPTAKRLATHKGIDITTVTGSGSHGKVMKADVASTTIATGVSLRANLPTVERIPLSPMRKIIARRMSESMFTAPHYYVTVEIDMTAAKAFRKSITTYKVSVNSLVLKAVINALAEWPQVNARWTEDAIEQISDVNLGIAVALPAGLIVPVLKQAQNLTLEEMVKQSGVLIEKARTGKLLPDDYTGNTFTVSNLGPFGVDHFTAIINQPDSAILAVGQMKDQVVAIDGGIHIRPIMKMTLSSDHRVIDGSIAAQFMARLKEILEAAEF